VHHKSITLQTICNTIVALICFIIVVLFYWKAINKPLPDNRADLAGSMGISSKPTTDLKTAQFGDVGSKVFGDYEVKILPEEDATSDRSEHQIPNRYEILHKAKLVRRSVTGKDAFGFQSLISEVSGEDITGNGLPNLVILSWSGGNHCCYQYEIFELGSKLRLLDTLDVGDAGEDSHFEKRGNDNNRLFVTKDYFFDLGSSFADSPTPKVILQYCDGKYRLADDVMRKPPIDKGKQAEIIKKIEDIAITEGQLPTLLWSTMLDLIYTGNENEAWIFFEKAWPKKRFMKNRHVAFSEEDPLTLPDKQESVRGFRKQLQKSKYWREIKMMNAGQKICPN